MLIKKITTIVKSSLCFILAASLAMPTAAAESSSYTQSAALNGSVWYNPNGTISSSYGNCVNSLGGNTNYAGDTILSEAQLNAIKNNQPIYEAAAAKYGFPWQILATMHYKERDLLLSNASNGQGIYQLYSYTRIPGTSQLDSSKAFLPAGPISQEEFARQTEIAANLVANNYGAGLDLNDPNDIQKLFFRFNGAAQSYINKALSMGFSQEEANRGAGSIYVMNRYDAPRDPAHRETMNPIWAGRYVGDGVYESGSVSLRFGAWVVYESLGGTGVCDGLTSGGMSYDEAYALIANYVNDPNECLRHSTASWCNIYDRKRGEIGANCVTFVHYFLSKYTTLNISNLGNGGDVTNVLINQYGLTDGGHTPRPYAVFSTRSLKWSNVYCGSLICGHTGIVLGINEAEHKIYIGQMGYGSKRVWGLTRIEYDLDVFANNEFNYAYTDQFLKQG